MSYSITKFKLKRLEDFTLPMGVLTKYAKDNCDWMEPILNYHKSENPEVPDWIDVHIELDEGCTIDGTLPLNSETLTVTGIRIFSCGSRNTLAYLLENIEHSTGVMEAILIWEGGQEIERLTIDNGKATTQTIDL